MKKKIDLLIIVVVTVLISLGIIYFYVVNVGFHKIESQIGRLLLTVVLGYFLYQESRLARWIFVVLYFLGGISFILTIVLSGFTQVTLPMLLVSVFYLAAALYLTFFRERVTGRSFQPHKQRVK